MIATARRQIKLNRTRSQSSPAALVDYCVYFCYRAALAITACPLRLVFSHLGTGWDFIAWVLLPTYPANSPAGMWKLPRGPEKSAAEKEQDCAPSFFSGSAPISSSGMKLRSAERRWRKWRRSSRSRADGGSSSLASWRFGLPASGGRSPVTSAAGSFCPQIVPHLLLLRAPERAVYQKKTGAAAISISSSGDGGGSLYGVELSRPEQREASKRQSWLLPRRRSDPGYCRRSARGRP